MPSKEIKALNRACNLDADCGHEEQRARGGKPTGCTAPPADTGGVSGVCTVREGLESLFTLARLSCVACREL